MRPVDGEKVYVDSLSAGIRSQSTKDIGENTHTIHSPGFPLTLAIPVMFCRTRRLFSLLSLILFVVPISADPPSDFVVVVGGEGAFTTTFVNTTERSEYRAFIVCRTNPEQARYS